MNSEINNTWQQFEQTGSIEAYLKYKEKLISQNKKQENTTNKKEGEKWG